MSIDIGLSFIVDTIFFFKITLFFELSIYSSLLILIFRFASILENFDTLNKPYAE